MRDERVNSMNRRGFLYAIVAAVAVNGKRSSEYVPFTQTSEGVSSPATTLTTATSGRTFTFYCNGLPMAEPVNIHNNVVTTNAN